MGEAEGGARLAVPFQVEPDPAALHRVLGDPVHVPADILASVRFPPGTEISTWTVAYAPLPAVATAASAGEPASSPLTAASEDVDLAIIKSPIVGTFYRAPDPESRPFAEVGQMVKTGQTLCIIEAMKLMNEINAECDGEVVKVYVENGRAVQYGERLFAIRPA